jgi:hypothetical protein
VRTRSARPKRWIVPCPLADPPAGKLAEAMSFLRDELQGEVAADVVEAHTRKAGIAIKTLKRARAKLGIVSRRDGFWCSR